MLRSSDYSEHSSYYLYSRSETRIFTLHQMSLGGRFVRVFFQWLYLVGLSIISVEYIF